MFYSLLLIGHQLLLFHLHLGIQSHHFHSWFPKYFPLSISSIYCCLSFPLLLQLSIVPSCEVVKKPECRNKWTTVLLLVLNTVFNSVHLSPAVVRTSSFVLMPVCVVNSLALASVTFQGLNLLSDLYRVQYFEAQEDSYALN